MFRFRDRLDDHLKFGNRVEPGRGTANRTLLANSQIEAGNAVQAPIEKIYAANLLFDARPVGRTVDDAREADFGVVFVPTIENALNFANGYRVEGQEWAHD